MEKQRSRKAFRWLVIAIAFVTLGIYMLSTLFSGKVTITTDELKADAAVRPAPIAVEGDIPEEEGWIPIAENDGFSMEWDGERVLFRLISKETGQIWESGYALEKLGEYSKRNRRVMTTLVQINYLDEAGAEAALNNTVRGVTTELSRLQNGIAIHFTFEEACISLTLQLYLDKWGFVARIPEESIQETGKGRLLSVEVLPAFGSLMTGDEGFLLYPDGCGALMDCHTDGKTAGVYTKPIYAERYGDLKEIEEAFAEGYTGVPIPYFGSGSHKGYGHIAYVESGAESARVNLSVGSTSLPLNRVYTTAVYRSSRKVTNTQGAEAITFPSEREQLDYRVHYSLVEKKAISYADLAMTLQAYLQEIHVLPTQKVEGTDIPVTVEWLISAHQDELLSSGNLVMTSFGDVEKALEDLEKSGVKSTRSLLLGWQKEGYGVYPALNTALGAAGGRSGMHKLLKTATDNRLFFVETDYVRANRYGHFSKRQDVVTDFMHTAVTDEEESVYMLNPLRQYDQFTRRDLPKFGKAGASGIAFNSIGRFLPVDSAAGREATGADVCNAYSQMLQKAQQAGMKTAVQTGPAFLLSEADYVYDAYDSTSGYHVFTESVPFYQMLLHGLVRYTGITPGNMSADFDLLQLHWAEYGCDPYFLLTKQSSARMQNASQNDVFNSRYDDWKEAVADTYQEFNSRLSGVQGQRMVGHEYLKPGVACVTYEDGSVLLVNYTQKPVKTKWGTTPARDYAVYPKGDGAK